MYTFRGYSLRVKNFKIYQINEETSHLRVALKGCEIVFRTVNLRKSTQITTKVSKYFWPWDYKQKNPLQKVLVVPQPRERGGSDFVIHITKNYPLFFTSPP